MHDDRLPSFCQCLRIAFHLQIFYLRQSESLSAGRLAWRINFRKNCVIASLTGVKSMEFPFIFSLGMGESRSISQKPKRILCKLWNGWKIRTNLYTIFDEVLCQQWDNSLSAAVLLRFAKTRVAPSPPYSILICRKTCDQLTTQLQPKSSCKRVFSDAVRSLHSIVSVVSSVLSPADTIPYSHYLTTDCVFLRPCQVFGDMRLQQNQILYHNGCE